MLHSHWFYRWRSLVAIPLAIIRWYNYCSCALFLEQDKWLSMHESNIFRTVSDTFNLCITGHTHIASQMVTVSYVTSNQIKMNELQMSTFKLPISSYLYPFPLPFCCPHLDLSMSPIFRRPCANISQRIWFPIHPFSSHLLQLNSLSISFVLSHKKIKRQEEEPAGLVYVLIGMSKFWEKNLD